jgi:hypothetical protein
MNVDRLITHSGIAMRPLLTVAITAFLFLFSTKASQSDYFPPGTLDDTERSSHFTEQWYSEQLRALKEPSLWGLSKTHTTQTYRFLWLRSFHRPISVRLDIQQAGTGVLTTKATNGQGGNQPGVLVMNKTRVLTKKQTNRALDRINAVGFWGLPSYEKPKERVGPNGEKTLEINLDGAQWILEGIKDGRYQIIDRLSPQRGPVRTVGLMMTKLAKLKFPHDEIY